MAGFLSFLPSLMGAASSNEGLIGSLKKAAGNVFSDLGSGKVNSGADFGKSLARGVAGLLGADQPPPTKNAADIANAPVAAAANAASTNAADMQPVRIMPGNQSEFAAARIIPDDHPRTALERATMMPGSYSDRVRMVGPSRDNRRDRRDRDDRRDDRGDDRRDDDRRDDDRKDRRNRKDRRDKPALPATKRKFKR